jgi:hypothetical protein
MNSKQLGILIVVLVLVGGAGLVLFKKQSAAWNANSPNVGKKLLGDFPLNDVASISISQGSNSVNLLKRNDEWRVDERAGYPADFSKIGGFLIKAADLKIVQSEQVGASQLPRLQLAPAGQGTNSATVVEFKDAKDKPVKILLLGKKHMKKSARPSPMGEGDEAWPDGRYVKVSDSPDVAVISDSLEDIEPKPEQWLDKSFFKIEKAKSIEVDFPVATNSWRLERASETNDWHLADAKPGEKLDPEKISAVTSPFSSPSFNDVLPAGQFRTETNGETRIEISTFDHFDYFIKVGAKTNDDYLLTVAVSAQIPKERVSDKNEKPADKTKLDKDFETGRQKLEDKLKSEQKFGNWIYLVSSWSVEPLLKDRAQLLAEKKPETRAGATNAVEKVEEPSFGKTSPAGVTNQP